MDIATLDVRAVDVTPGSEFEAPVLPEHLNQIPDGEEIGTVTADGTCDTRLAKRPSSTGRSRRFMITLLAPMISRRLSLRQTPFACLDQLSTL